ncbi:MAG: hypothetical protein R3C62_22120 [Chloroflexota bacterium]
MSNKKLFCLLVLGLLLAACGEVPVVLPTAVSPAEVAVVVKETAVPTVPATWTPQAVADAPTPDATELVPPTSTPLPTRVIPTNTTVPTATATVTETAVPVTNTPIPPTPIPTNTPVAPSGQPTGANLLPNPSFEEGHYNMNGVAELQLPNGWLFEWDEGPTGYGTEAWDVWVRPETRVLSDAFLPVSEHALYIWDGNHTVKIFKGHGAISYRLLTDVVLQPGAYELKISYFPDLVMGYHNDQKLYADDPLAGEIRLFADGNVTGWIFPAFGQRNTTILTFTVDSTHMVRVGFAARGRFALNNNGWFMDDWSLRRLE